MAEAILLHMPNCCCKTCVKLTDEFGRTSVGGDYDERSGTWSATTTDGGLLQTSSSDASIVTVADIDNIPAAGMVVTGGFFGTSGNKVRLIVDWVDDNNFHFVEIELGQVPVYQLSSSVAGHEWSIFKRTAGVDTLLASGLLNYRTIVPGTVLAIGDTAFFTVCAWPGYIVIHQGSTVGWPRNRDSDIDSFFYAVLSSKPSG